MPTSSRQKLGFVALCQLLVGSALSPTALRAELTLTMGTEFQSVRPIESSMDEANGSLLGVDRALGGPALIQFTVPEDRFRCPGMERLGCSGRPLLVEARFDSSMGAFAFARERVRPRVNFYTSVLLPPQETLGLGYSTAYTRYVFRESHDDLGLGYRKQLAASWSVEASVSWLSHEKRYLIGQHTWYERTSGERAIFAGETTRTDRARGPELTLDLTREVLPGLDLGFGVTAGEAAGRGRWRGVGAWLDAADALLAELGHRPLYADAGVERYRVAMGSFRVRGTLRRGHRVSLRMELGHVVQTRSVSDHDRLSTDMSGELAAVNLAALGEVFAARRYRQIENYGLFAVSLHLGGK